MKKLNKYDSDFVLFQFCWFGLIWFFLARLSEPLLFQFISPVSCSFIGSLSRKLGSISLVTY